MGITLKYENVRGIEYIINTYFMGITIYGRFGIPPLTYVYACIYYILWISLHSFIIVE